MSTFAHGIRRQQGVVTGVAVYHVAVSTTVAIAVRGWFGMNICVRGRYEANEQNALSA